MRFLRTVLGNSDSGLRAIGRRYFEEYAKRKRRNEAEYNTVIKNLTAGNGAALLCGFAFQAMEQRCFAGSMDAYAKRSHVNNVAGRRYFSGSTEKYSGEFITVTKRNVPHLLRDLYHAMVVKDRVKPEIETFLFLFIGTMKGSLLDDAIFFKEEMKKMGFVLNVDIFNLLISTCIKCHDSDQAYQIWNEMKKYQVTPTNHTYVGLLNAFAADGRLDRVYEVVGFLIAVGRSDKFCYAALIAAYKNERPLSCDIASKILQLVELSKGSEIIVRDVMQGISIEEFYNLPTADYLGRRGFKLNRSLAVYHMAFHACADLKEIKAMEALYGLLIQVGEHDDSYILKEMMRCYLNCQNLELGLQVFEQYMNSKIAVNENFFDKDFFVMLMEGAMIQYTPRGMQIAYDTLLKMMGKNIWMKAKDYNNLLQVASGDSTDDGNYGMANLLWDTININGLPLEYYPTEAYYQGLRGRKIPDNDPRLTKVKATRDILRDKQRTRWEEKQDMELESSD